MLLAALAESTRVTVMGLGRFGGGLGVTRFLAERGCDVLVTDLAGEDALAGSLAGLRRLIDSGGVTLRLGGHNVSDFTDTDVVIASPAVPRPGQNRFLRSAAAAGVPITTEIRLGLELLNPSGFGSDFGAQRPGDDSEPHVIGITGTAGKSTTAAMTHAALSAAGVRAELAGNIGRSLFDPALRDAVGSGQVEVLVLEVSSAQLWWLGRDVGYQGAHPWACDTAVVTSFAPNHLDWHGDTDDYRACKQRLIIGSGTPRKPSGVILGPSVAGWQAAVGARFANMEHGLDRVWDMSHVVVHGSAAESEAVYSQGLALPGPHNRSNALLAALAAYRAAGGECSPDVLLEAAGAFPGLPHRLRLVYTGVQGVRAFDDSKCTTPEGAALAVAALGDPIGVVLIAGGYDKGVDLSPMIEAAAGCAAVCTIGTTGDTIADGIEAAGGKAVRCGDLERAVEVAAQEVRAGLGVGRLPVVLLSPGCASWDQFSSYEERGDRFTACVREALDELHLRRRDETSESAG